MKKTKCLLKMVLAAVLTAIIAVTAAACDGGKDKPGPSVTPTPGPSTGVEETLYKSADYVHKYGDYDAMNEWLEKNVNEMYAPPVTFNLNGMSSANLSWKKEEGEWNSIIDFAEEDRPSERKVKEISYVCEDEGLKVVLELTLYADYPALEWNANLYNISGGTSKLITNLLAFNHIIEDNEGVKYLHANRGSTISYTDFEPLTSRLKDSQHFEVTSGRGSTSTYIPYFNVENKVNNTGTIAIMTWQGQWKADFSNTSAGVKLQAGQYETALKLQDGEKMRYPGAVLLFYKGDRMNGQNVYRRWLYNCNLFREQGKHMDDKSAMVMGPYNDEEKDMAALQLYADTGLTDFLDRFNLDIGWEEGTVAGNWYANHNYPDGLKPLADAVHALGLDFAVWFEPERVQRGTEVEAALKDIPNAIIGIDASGKIVKDITTLPDRTSMLVNYAEEEALDYIINLINGYIQEYDIDHYRQDFNIDPQPFWRAQDTKYSADLGIERVGYTENQYCTGYLRVFEELLKANPGLYIDACASGGQRNDLDTVRYSYMHTRSDYWADIESAQLQTYGSSMWFMYWGTGFSSADLNLYDVRSHIGNSIGTGISSEEGAAALAAALADWEHLAPYLFFDYYPLTDYVANTRKTASMQYDSPEKGIGMFITYFRKDDSITLCPRGLDPSASYEIWNLDSKEDKTIKSGAEIMQGITVSSVKETAVIYEYKLAEGSDTSAFQTQTVPVGPGSTDFDPSAILEEGQEVENVDAPSVDAQYNPGGKTDEELLALYDAAEITEDNMIIYLAKDYRSTGNIYAVSENVFNEMPRSALTLSGGWTAVDKTRSGFVTAGDYYSWTVYNNWYWENEIYMKEIEGRYFMWFSCVVGLSDSDGGWDNHEITLRWTKADGTQNSTEIMFYCESASMQDVNLEGADTLDGKGKIFSVTEAMFGSFSYTGNGIYMNNMLWYEIDSEKIGIISVFQKVLPEYASPQENLVLLSDVISKDVGAYACVDEDGNYFIWLRGYEQLPWFTAANMSPVGRSLLCWYDKNGELCMQTMVHR